jgi:imidazoleglycerol phosphate dehydratase HisB
MGFLASDLKHLAELPHLGKLTTMEEGYAKVRVDYSRCRCTWAIHSRLVTSVLTSTQVKYCTPYFRTFVHSSHSTLRLRKRSAKIQEHEATSLQESSQSHQSRRPVAAAQADHSSI